MRAAFIFAFLPLVLGQEYKLLHRIYHPLNPEPVAFSERATFTLTGANVAPLVTPENVPNDLEEFAEVAHILDGAFYQLALQREGDEHEGHWAISSVKACHLPKSTSETIILHQDTAGKPFSLDYFVSPIPDDGACPTKKANPAKFRQISNTTVLTRSPRVPPSPELRVPPPLTPQGEPVQAVPEKSFIQKYWIYILVALGALLLSGGVEDEEPKKAAK